MLRKISSLPVHILTGIRILCTPSRNSVHLSTTGISKPPISGFVLQVLGCYGQGWVQNDAVLCTRGPRDMLYTSD